MKIAFLGCGFLTTHIIHDILPHSSHIFLIDRERIEKANYENSIFPKNLVGKRKVTVLTSYIQILSSVPVTPIHKNITNSGQLTEIYDKTKFNFIICTFDNIKSRIITKEFALNTNIPSLFIGVTEGYIYIDWAENLVLPETEADISKTEEEMKRIRDVCTRLDFRVLGTIASGYAYFSILKWLNKKEKNAFMISVKDNINSVKLQRGI